MIYTGKADAYMVVICARLPHRKAICHVMLGYDLAFPIYEIVLGMEIFAYAVIQTNPDIMCSVIWHGCSIFMGFVINCAEHSFIY